MMNTTTSAQRKRKRRELIRRRWLDGFSLFSLLAAFLLIFTAGILGVRGIPLSPSASASFFTVPTTTVTVTRVTATPAPTFTPFYTATPLPIATYTPTITASAIPEPLTIAIIAGHRNNDSGAICEGELYEGLYEVHVTTAVTEHLVAKLTEQGHTVLDLDEYDERLAGLVANAVVSIHADSCVEWNGTTGYKVAHVLNSAIPEVEDRFVGCMEQEYGVTTNLPLHAYSVTHNMTRYHAFGKIDLNTPAVIIEVGFLYHDHHFLTQQPDLVAEGIKKGIECFLYGGVPEPVEGVPEPVEGVPEPVEGVPEPVEPVEGVPEPVEGVPEPVEGVPEPVEGVPEPVEGVPEPVEGVPEPVEGG